MMASDIPSDRRGQLEGHKLPARRGKLNRDRSLAPWALLASLLGGTVVAVIWHFWR
jgi:hypothetical protein